MKHLSMGFVFVLVALALIIVPTIASADVDVPNCQIARIGVDPNQVGPPVQLIDVSGGAWTGQRQFYLSSELGNQGLATLLTAYAMGKNLWVRIAGDASSGSLIKIIFIRD